jgi:sugar/nucleoside kinase (ribokinase family)
MIIVLGDILADVNLRISSFPVQAGSLLRAEYLELGPGGATNVAIMAARLGLSVACLGEVGQDRFGDLVLAGLRRESVDVSRVIVSAEAETPVAGVIVDQSGEPAYLGYPGSLQLQALPSEWHESLSAAEAVFADGWAENDDISNIILEGLRRARHAGVPTFFDPGPGNPAVGRAWLSEAAALATVLLATEDEARSLTGRRDPMASARELLSRGPELLVLKRDVAGCVLITRDEVRIAPGLPVEALDATGAGDSLDAAVIYGYLRALPLADLGTLANATGAAKVQKLGTGHNLPTLDEVRAMLERFNVDPAGMLPVP